RQVIQLSGFPISRRVAHLMSQPRFAFAKSHAPPSASSGRSVARPALAYGFPSRWLGGEGFFQPSGSADMPGTQKRPEDVPPAFTADAASIAFLAFSPRSLLVQVAAAQRLTQFLHVLGKLAGQVTLGFEPLARQLSGLLYGLARPLGKGAVKPDAHLFIPETLEVLGYLGHQLFDGDALPSQLPQGAQLFLGPGRLDVGQWVRRTFFNRLHLGLRSVRLGT